MSWTDDDLDQAATYIGALLTEVSMMNPKSPFPKMSRWVAQPLGLDLCGKCGTPTAEHTIAEAVAGCARTT